LIEINPGAAYGEKNIEGLLLNAGYKKYYLDNAGTIVTNQLADDTSNNYLFIAGHSTAI
jgi:hypothetical protein